MSPGMVSEPVPAPARPLRRVRTLLAAGLLLGLAGTQFATAPSHLRAAGTEDDDGQWGQVMAPEPTPAQFTTEALDAIAAPAPAAADGTTGVSGPTSFAGTLPANTDFQLRFDSSVDAASRSVLNAAAGVWSAVLATKVPITVDVTMQPMGSGLLGSAGPTSAFYGRSSFPRQDVLYPVALANQFAAKDLDTAQSDIAVTLSSNFGWDKSLDGSAPGQSLLTVAIHELGHGLGHTSWVRDEGAGLVVGYQVGGQTLALVYDTFVKTSSGTGLLGAVGDLLASLVTSPLYWSGPNGVAANGGTRPRLYAPSSFESGSSVGHLDEGSFPGELMTPDLHDTERIFSVSSRTQAVLADIGWTLQSTSSTSGTTSLSTSGKAAFVKAIVTDFLGRAATSAEVDQWVGFLNAGGTRGQVADAFAYSDAWVGVIVDGLYQSTLGRLPDAGGRAYWVGVIKSGASPADVASQFYASAEYFTRSGGTVTAWIKDLYREVLGREADSGGLAYWAQRTVAGGRTPVARDFYQSVESRRTRVEGLYRKLLGRGPDGAGLGYWIGVLADGRDVELAKVLAASDEYLSRAIKRFT